MTFHPPPVKTNGERAWLRRFDLFPVWDDAAFQLKRTADWKIQSISNFDHWLDQQEFRVLPYTEYAEAVNAGRLAEFLEYERKFMSLFAELGRDGMLFQGTKGLHLRQWSDPAARAMVRGAVREQYCTVYFINAQVVMFNGWTLTMHFWAKDQQRLDQLNYFARRHGLNPLPV